MPTPSNPRTRARASGLGAIGLFSLSLVLPGAPIGKQLGPHGAAPEARQVELLQQLLPTGLSLVAPEQMDPIAWRQTFSGQAQPSLAELELGRALFFDPRLSMDTTVSCATCHDVTRAFADRRPVSEGIRGQLGRRNAPTVMNAALLQPLFWDGRARNAEHQAVMPLLNPVEMGMPNEAAVVERVLSIASYRQAFERLYPDGVTYENVGLAIGAFERALIFMDAPFDRFLAGDQDAISADAKAGWELFHGQARCMSCHPINRAQPLGTDQAFHNIGVSARRQDFEKLAKEALVALQSDPSEQQLDRLALSTDLSELGRFMITKARADVGSFRTPQLRNIGITAPYMHDGSMITLWDVMDHYNKGGEDNPYLDGSMEALALDETQIDQIVAFLFTLTDERLSPLNRSSFEQQHERSRQQRPFRDEALASRRQLGFEKRVLGDKPLPR